MQNFHKTMTLATALGLIGCSDDKYPGYHFDGDIQNNHVVLKERGGLSLLVGDEQNYVHFIDKGPDMKVDYVTFRNGEEQKTYGRSDKIGKAVVDLAQPVFTRYMEGIETANITTAQEELKAIDLIEAPKQNCPKEE